VRGASKLCDIQFRNGDFEAVADGGRAGPDMRTIMGVPVSMHSILRVEQQLLWVLGWYWGRGPSTVGGVGTPDVNLLECTRVLRYSKL
jgi:hypothetical protein